MEKRILLSLVLSFLVLIFWQMIFPAPKAPEQAINMQRIGNKEVIEKSQYPATTESDEKTKEKGLKVEEKLVTLNNGKIQAVLTTNGGTIKKATILEYNADIPVKEVLVFDGFSGVEYTIDSATPEEVSFVAHQDELTIRKTYRFPDGEFLGHVDIAITNGGEGPVAFDPGLQIMRLDTTMFSEDIEKSRDRNLLEYSVFSDGKVVRKTGAFRFTQKDAKEIAAPVEWFGFRNRYYCMMVRPKFAIKGYRFLPSSDEKQLSMRALMDSMILNKGETAVLMSDLYVGPQRSDVLKRYDMNFEKIHVYFRAEFFDAIAKIIEDLVKLMYKFSSNWGVSIILVSFLIYFSMYPLTMKSMLSMQKMQGLQPKIAELRTKHEKNPQKLNQEIMKLYGENKVNPMGGCLPLLLQMPVFICLYQMIWRSVLFKGAGFLWIKDLSEPDRLIILKKSFPIIGNEINVFPVIILILMVIQQKMTAKNMNVTDPNQLAQQKMMAFMMPIMLLLVFYRIASGLTLYLTVFYILSSFTQWRVAKKVKAVK